MQQNHDIHIDKALELYNQYCPCNKNYPHQIQYIIKILQLDSFSLIAVLLYTNIQYGFNIENHKHYFNDDITYLFDVINKLSSIHNKPCCDQQVHFRNLLLTVNDKLQETAVLTALVPLLHKVSIFNINHNNAHSLHISKIITNCYIPYLLSCTVHNDLAYILQDLCFKIQYPEEYNRILQDRYLLYPDIHNIINNIDNQFKSIFRQLNIKASLSYRIKSPYSIWIKTLVKNIHITALNDIIGFRVIVPNKKACYDVSNTIHLHYNTITSQFIDYIRYPKKNGYQSIHLVISGSGKGNIEIQIRSTGMHMQTQCGSPHSHYKMAKYYTYRSNHNMHFILYSITLNSFNKTPGYYINIVIISIINNNLCTHNALYSFILPQYSSNVTNNTTILTLNHVTVPIIYIKYYNNYLLPLIKHSDTINNNLSLNINLNLSNWPVPLAVAQILPHNISLTHSNNDLIKITYKPTCLPDDFLFTTTYTNTRIHEGIHEYANSKSKLLLQKRDIANKPYTTLFGTINNKVILEQYSQKGKWLSAINTCNIQRISILELLINREITNIVSSVSDHNKDILLYYAPQFDRPELVPLLIAHGADINAKNNSETVVHAAAKSGQFDIVQLLINKGADINSRTDDGDTVLHCAAKSWNVALVRYLVEKCGADINATNNRGETALHHAVIYYCDLVLVQLLIVHGTDVNIKNNDGETVLHYAVEDNNLELVQILIKNGADINDKNNDGKTVLHYAIRDSNLELVQILVKKGGDINSRTDDNKTVLHCIAKSGNLDLVYWLICNGANINAKTDDNKTVLHFAAKSSNLDLVYWLICNGANINAKTDDNKTVLHFAAKSGNLDLVYWLICNGANINAKTDDNKTVLHFAAESGNLDLVYWLICNGANINAKTDSGETVLHYAILCSNIDLVRWLICNGANINAKTDDNETILHFAAKSGNLDLVYWLIYNGADINAKTDDGLTVLYYAIESDNPDLLVRWLIYNGADINAKTDSGETVLHYAILRSNIDLVRWLIYNGADVNAKTNSGDTILHRALLYNKFNIVKYLYGANINLDVKPEGYDLKFYGKQAIKLYIEDFIKNSTDCNSDPEQISQLGHASCNHGDASDESVL